MSTIYDIANATGISPSTVARALRGTGYCSNEKREIILDCARRLGYVSIHAAKALKTKRTNKVLFCIPDVDNPFYFRMINGVINILEKYGYYVMLCYSKRRPELELRMVQNLLEHYGDGLIMVSLNVTAELIEAINACHMPVVLSCKCEQTIGKQLFDNVFTDTQVGIELATKHLLDMGHRKLAFLGRNDKNTTSRVRLQGFLNAMNGAGVAVENKWIMGGDFTSECGYVAAKAMIETGNLPTGIVCANDMMAIGFMQSCEERGVRVPQDMSITGMDNTEVASYLRPRLTSVVMNEEAIGYHSSDLLMDRIAHGARAGRTVCLQPELAVGDSSAPPGIV